jgi:all-trans-retinol dehydrogenase (NAD+)
MTVLAGRTSLVTGAGSGIGRLLSLDLARRGSRLVLWDLDLAAAELVAKEIVDAGGTAAAYRCDVTDRLAVRELAERVRAEVGDVDVLVNNAGVVSGKPFLELEDRDIERTFAVNTLALYWTTKAFLPRMIERSVGHVVTIASAAGLVGVARQVDYSASKHAAVGFDESLRAELAQAAPAIRTTVVCPYYIDTGMFEGVRTRFQRLLPVLQPDAVVARIVRAIERDEPRVVMPPLVHLVPLAHSLPARWGDRLMDLFGVNHSMDRFVGRR